MTSENNRKFFVNPNEKPNKMRESLSKNRLEIRTNVINNIFGDR